MLRIRKWIKAGSPDALPADVAAATLKVRLRAVRQYLPLAADKSHEDVEHVHQLRVSTRRATAALKLYREFLPRNQTRWMWEQLKRIRKAAGDARDLDVFARRLKECEPTSETKRLLKRIEKLRHKAQRPIKRRYRKLCKSGRLDRRIRKLLSKARRNRGSGDCPQPMFGDWAREQIEPVVDRFVDAGRRDLTDVEALHQFRIEGKTLRYTMELLGGAFPAEFRDVLYPQVEVLQEKLGLINDFAAAEDRIRRWIEADKDRCDRDFLQLLLKDAVRNQEQARQAFLDWWSPEQLLEFRTDFDKMLLHQSGRPTQRSAEGSER